MISEWGKIIVITFIMMFSVTSVSFAKENSPQNNLPYNYSDTTFCEIRLNPIETISTKDEILEGQKVQFKVQNDVFCQGNKILQKGKIVEARLEMVVLPGRAGLPAELTIDNFEIPNVKQSQLISEYNKIGHYRWWYRTIKLSIPPPASFFPIGRFIKGGHASIKPEDVIKLKYYPNWE